MKTTIEVNGYQIVIDETAEAISVTATKDDETIEEFTLEIGEEGSIDAQEETDFPQDLPQGEEEIETPAGDEDDDLEDEPKIESYAAFLERKK